jgi:nucleoside-diphosphate-sugar epimerase
VHNSKENVVNDLTTNVIGLIHVLNALRNNGNKPFVILAGTATEVGYSDERKPLNEECCSDPVTFYDISKLTAERYLLQYVREGWIDGCALRLCNVYGGTRHGQNSDRGIIDKIFQRALKGESVNIYGSGDYVRDYIHLDDVVAAFWLAWENRDQVTGQFFNLGTGVGTALTEAFHLVSQLAEEVSGKKVTVSSIEPPAGLSQMEYRSFVADNRKFVEATNWSPRYSLESGIRYSYSNLFHG